MTGVIVVNKEQSFTSFDVVAVMRGICKQKKIGHTGTLDPMATGVLPILIGNATKACDLIPESDKTYKAGFKFGIKTTTGDIWGEVKEENTNKPSNEELLEILHEFTGQIFQLPPMYSAVSVGGQRLYKLARQGIEIEREKREVFISELSLDYFDGVNGELTITCSKGTYIRTLIEDIAEKLDCVATMTSLIRLKANGFNLSQSYTLDKLKELAANNQLECALFETKVLFENLPLARLTQAQETRFLNGGFLSLNRLILPKILLKDNDVLRVFGSEFLGLGIVEGENLKFLKKFYNG